MTRSPVPARFQNSALALLMALVLALVPGLWASAAPPEEQPHITGTVVGGVREVRLPSGQMLYIKEDHSSPIVTIDTWVRTGSVNETAEINGVSHFLEHLLFKGTDRYKVGEIDRLLESKGAEFNAATSDDFTHYYLTIASPFFEDALRLHAHMLQRAALPPQELDRERRVVQEEINRAVDNPQRKLFIRLGEMLYGKHPYALDTLGPKSVIAGVPREKIMDYYRYWYRPQHLNTVIVGDVDPQKAIALVSEVFPAGGFPEGGHYRPAPVETAQPPAEPQAAVLEEPDLTHGYLSLAFMGPDINRRDDIYALDVAMLALGAGKSSRLYQALKEQSALVTDVGAGNLTQKHAGMVYTFLEAKPENLAAARDMLVAELRRLKAGGITPAELEKAKTQTIKDFIFHTESTEGVASSIGYNVTIGTLNDYTDYVANIQHVSADDVREAANRYLDFNRAVIVALLPQGKANIQEEQKALLGLLAQGAETAGETPTAPKTGVQHDEAVSRRVLANGMTLITKPRKDSQTVALKLLVRGGEAVETLPGLAALTAQMLTRGTTTRTAAAISEELEARGMNLTVSAAEDYLDISATAVTEDLGELFAVLRDVLVNATLPEEKLAQEKALMLQAIAARRDNPSAVALDRLMQGLYPTHPYGNVGERVAAHLPLIDREHVLAYYRRYVVPRNMVVSAVGRFDPDTLARYLETGLPAGFNEASDLAANPLETSPEVPPLGSERLVTAGKTAQGATWLGQAWLAPTVRGEDYVPLKVLNSLLGTGMSSRLFVNLREKQGLAYSVSSFFPGLNRPSRFVLFIGTDPKNRKAVEAGFAREIRRLQSEPVPAQELQEAKDKLAGAFALAHETNLNQAFYLGFYEMMGLGYGFDALYPEKIRAVTAEEVQRVAQTVFSRPRVVSVVAPGLPSEGLPPAGALVTPEARQPVTADQSSDAAKGNAP